jgi:hypothetical protein
MKGGAMFHKGIIVLFVFALIAGITHVAYCENMEAVRISPQDAHQQVAAGKALMVCAYEDEQACGKIMLEGGISLQEFERKLPELKKDQLIIFFCA